MRRLPLVLCTALLTLALAGWTPLPAEAQTAPPAPAAESAPTAVAGGFGRAMAGTGDWLFVGDPSSVHAPGRVVVYRRDGGEWAEAARLEAGDAEVGDGFGGAVAADGDRLVVGAPASGAVYVFQQTGSSEGGGEWTQTARLTPSTSPTGQFGGTVAVRGDVVFAGVTSAPFTMNPGPGAVTTFRTDGESWEETQTLQPDDLAGGDGFGEALAVTDTHLFVGAPGTSGRSGAVHVFDTSGDGTWTRAQTLTGVSGRFGAALATRGAVLWIGAPRADRQRGAVQAARLEGDAWSIGSARLQPFDGPANARFGVSLAVTDDGTVWAGAPGAGDDAGALYGFARGEDGGWSRATRHRHPDTRAGDRLGSVLTAAGPDLAVGQPGTDYGAYMSGGSVVALFDAASGSWRGAPLTPPSRDVFSAVTGGKVDCRDGTAQVFDCEGVDLLSFLPIEDLGGERGVRLNDVWGWTDPETGRDYALVGRVDGTAFVDVTDPMNPVYVGELPKTEGSEAKIWRDVKVYQNHAFVVADNAGEHGMQVFDLTELRDVAPSERPKTFAETARYDGIHSAHNVFINQETGFAYVVAASGGGRTCGGGLHMVNVQEPTSPSFAGCFADPSTGRTGTGTTHDTQCIVYDGPDTDYQGREICFSANETAVSIADVTDKQNPESIATVSHPKSAYVHQGWLTEDRRYLYVNDELDELSGLVDRTRTLVFDVVDLDDPQLVTEFFLPTPASDHNLYVRGSTMYQANYTSGLRVVDISDPENPKEVGHFDTLPFGPDAPGFEGAFSNYPYFESGVVVVTSMQEGLFVVKKAETEL